MFGYVTICEPELKRKDWRRYRAYYCGLCRTLRERHGHLGQMTLSYDMTFAVMLLTSLYESEPRLSEHRCKTHPVKKQKMLQNEITEYCADMNVLLSYYHLKDNWADERKVSGLAGSAALRRKAEQIAERYPRQSEAMRRELKNLSAYEKADSQNIDEPAGCFGRLMEELFVWREDAWEKSLREMGFFLGKFIYIMDAYEDLEKDLKEGCYNPLRKLYEAKGKRPVAENYDKESSDVESSEKTYADDVCGKQQAENVKMRTEYEKQIYDILCMMVAETSAAFEKLPCLWEADILRNILYMGVWSRYRKIQEKESEKSPTP